MNELFTLCERDISLLPIFQNIPKDLLEQITPDMICFYGDGDIILAEGAPADNLLVLLSGQVRVFLNGTYLVTRYPYAVIGEQAFINRTGRSATVIAQGLVKALVLPQAIVEQFIENAAFTRNLLRLLSEKLTEASSERAYHFRNEQLLFSEFRAHLSPEDYAIPHCQDRNRRKIRVNSTGWERSLKLMLDNTPVQVFDTLKIDANALDCRTGNNPLSHIQHLRRFDSP